MRGNEIKMIVDILSDLHVDFYFKGIPSAKAVESVYKHIFTDNQKRTAGDVLVVAGDIGHYNPQNIHVLELIQEIFGYKHIICVLGNHDYYLVDTKSRERHKNNSFNRTSGMRRIINNKEGMYCLDGEIIEIEGVKFGGCDSWYDGSYAKKHFDECPVWKIPIDDIYMYNLWMQTMNDSHYIHQMDWQEYAQLEKEKIEKIYKEVDVMITHINPSLEKEHTHEIYREETTTGFFTFDGTNFLKNGSMKYWIYGHTHTEAEHDIHGVKCICSLMGYPGENGIGEWTWIKSIEI